MPRKKKSLQERRQFLRNALIVSGAVFALLSIAGIAYVARIPELTISTVEVSGTHFVQKSLVEASVSDMLSGSYFFLIPRKNSLFYPKNELEDTLKETYGALNEVSVHRANLATITVSIQEREPAARWCSRIDITAPCYVLDKDGYAFAEEDATTQGLFIYEGENLSVGDVFLNGSFEKLKTFVERLSNAIKHVPERIVVDANNDVFVHIQGGGEVRFAVRDISDSLLENVASVFSSKRFTSGEAFEYVDFRFGNKVYVKFKGE